MQRIAPKIYTELGVVVHTVPMNVKLKRTATDSGEVPCLRAPLSGTEALHTYFYADDGESLQDLVGKESFFDARVMYRLSDGLMTHYIEFRHLADASPSAARKIIFTSNTILKDGVSHWMFIPLPPPRFGTLVVLPRNEVDLLEPESTMVGDVMLKQLKNSMSSEYCRQGGGIMHEMSHALGADD